MFLLAFPAGVSAALSPCVIILIPLLMCRFVEKEKRGFTQMSLLTMGFISTFIMFGLFLQTLLSSSFGNGVRLGLGLLFATLGAQSLIGKVSPMQFPLFKNPFLLGISFACLVTFNPCTMPYLGILLSMFRGAELLLQMFLFSLGMITPAILFTLFGQSILSAIQSRTQSFFHWMNKALAVMLIACGIYLAISIHGLTWIDSLASSIVLALCFLMVMRTYAEDTSIKGIFKSKKTVAMCAILISLVMAAFLSCYFASFCKVKRNISNDDQLEDENISGSETDKKITSEESQIEQQLQTEQISQPLQTNVQISNNNNINKLQKSKKNKEFEVSFRPDFEIVYNKEKIQQGKQHNKKMQVQFEFDDSFAETKHFGESFTPSVYPQYESEKMKYSKHLPFMSVYDPSSMSPRQTVAVVLPPADEQLSCSANPLAHVCCAAVAPCPGCKYCTIAQLCALVIGIAAILLLSPKNVDLSGIVHDTCTVPKFKKQNQVKSQQES